MNIPWPILALMGLLGLAIGSFLNVVIYRVPRHESIMFPASRCTVCQTPIKPWHNVPVFSWLALRGRCAACHAVISPRYFFVELATAGLFVAITLRFRLAAELPAYLYLGAAAITLLMIGLDLRQLPNKIVLPSYFVTVLLFVPAGAAGGTITEVVRALIGMTALWAVFFAVAIAFPAVMTFNDANLAGLMGLYLGWLSWAALLIGGFGTFLLGAVGTATLLVTRRKPPATTAPFGSLLIVAAALAVFIAVPVTHWYGSMLTIA
jgi:leader peptidase (prepilin peptidase) / N-methyltransferase